MGGPARVTLEALQVAALATASEAADAISHASQAHAEAEHAALLGHLMAKAAEIARGAGLDRGYRVVINTGPDGGQSVDHLHLHLLGGRHMGWPPG